MICDLYWLVAYHSFILKLMSMVVCRCVLLLSLMLIIQAFYYLLLYLFSAVEHVFHGKALKK